MIWKIYLMNSKSNILNQYLLNEHYSQNLINKQSKIDQLAKTIIDKKVLELGNEEIIKSF